MNREQRRIIELQNKAILDLKNKDNRMKFWTYEDTLNADKKTDLTIATVHTESSSIYALLLSIQNQNINMVGIDCETTSINIHQLKLHGIGLSWSHDECHYMVFNSDTHLAIHKLLDWLNNSKYCDVIWCMHNAKFDMMVIYKYFGFWLNNIEDSMVMHYVLYPYKRHKLASLAAEYLGRYPLTYEELTHQYDGQINKVPLQQIADYCGEDCYEALVLCKLLKEQLFKTSVKLLEIYLIDRNMIHTLCNMEWQGICIDNQKIDKLLDRVPTELEVIEDDIHLLAGRKFNIKSSQQVSDILFNDLKISTDGIPKTQKGYSTAKEVLQEIKDTHPIVELLVEHRTVSKLLSSFIQPLKNEQINGKIHTNYLNTRTVTGRLASQNPNLQNIPNPQKSKLGKLIRSCFIPSKDYVFIDLDYSQFELRILAHMSRDIGLVNAFNSGVDLHAYVTELLFDIKYDPGNPQHVLYRTLTKNINFGLIYGLTVQRFYLQCVKAGISITLNKCQDIFNKYWITFPGVRTFLDVCALNAIDNGYVETLWGRRRYFLEFKSGYLKVLRNSGIDKTSENMRTLEAKKVITPYDASMLRECGNFPIQGTNADVIRKVMGELNLICNNGLRILLQVHDELVFECKFDNAVYMMQNIKSIMENVVELYVPVKVSGAIADNWGDCK